MKKTAITAITILSGIVTLIVPILPDEFPYLYRLFIIIGLVFFYILVAVILRFTSKQRLAIIPILFILLLLFFFRGSFPIVLSSETIVPWSSTKISFQGESISPALAKRLRWLHKLTYISFENCKFENKASSSLSFPKSLKTVSIKSCDGIDDFSCLTDLENLRSLSLEDCGLSNRNFPSFLQTQLLVLSIKGNEGISDLRWLPETLMEVNISETAVADVTELAKCYSLEYIYADNTLVSDLSPIASLSTLKSISFNDCKLKEITADFMSLRLNSISVARNSLSDCSGFQSLSVLDSVNLSANLLTDVSWLGKSKLSYVDLSSNMLTDISCLNNSIDLLTNIYLSNNPLDSEDLTFLESAIGVRELGINNIHVESLDFIKRMTSLKRLEATYCGIDDISALQYLTPRIVLLSGNKIRDISALTSSDNGRYDLLDISGNPLNGEHFGGFRNQTYNKIILLDYVDWLSYTKLPFSKIYVVDCPLDQRVAVEDSNGIEKVSFITREEVNALRDEALANLFS